MENTLGLAVFERDPDMALVARAGEGSGEAFDVLFERHRQFIYNVCYRMLGSTDDATDATQTAFIQAYGAIGSFRGGSTFRSWLCRIAINCATQTMRQQRRRRLLMLKTTPPNKPEASGDTVWEAILELSPEMRAPLVLFYFHDLSTEDVAEALGYSAAAARTRLHRARAAFKKKFEELIK